jgi:hypothetical protein
MALFNLGKIVATPGALDVLMRSSQSPGEFLTMHARGEWGNLDAFDTEANQTAIREGGRIFSTYKTRCDDDLWIITEEDRSSTCILLPSDY